MERPLSRRRVGSWLSAALVLPLAGCSQSGETSVVDEPLYTLTISLEREDGTPISAGVIVLVTVEAERLTTEYHESDIDDGTVRHEGVAGEYLLSVEPAGDRAFEPVETDLTVESDERVTLVVAETS
ncbi:hypothetical protein [Natronobiforma cellulositropha]|uniref:hypothetical protein n=1 Tax=Natronobiforma cellulositropha TaxID=1679076 RepID=UPI0021D58C83|nr:hypothetical protein [Natronobiforma cellulositropha]